MAKRLMALYEGAAPDLRALALAATDAVDRLLGALERGPEVHRGTGHNVLGPDPSGDDGSGLSQDEFYELDGARQLLEAWVDRMGWVS